MNDLQKQTTLPLYRLQGLEEQTAEAQSPLGFRMDFMAASDEQE